MATMPTIKLGARTADIYRLDEATEGATRQDVIATLAETLREVQDGDYGEVNKCVILMLDDNDMKYDVKFATTGVTCSEMVSLLEILKGIIMKSMGFA